MTYDEWMRTVPAAIREDNVWNLEAFRLGLFLSDIAWNDITKLARDRRTHSLSDQLQRAVGGITLTISEGFSRSTGKERARFYEYSLGSARETRIAYYQGRHVLGETVFTHRLDISTRVVKLTLTMVRSQRRENVKLQ